MITIVVTVGFVPVDGIRRSGAATVMSWAPIIQSCKGQSVNHTEHTTSKQQMIGVSGPVDGFSVCVYRPLLLKKKTL